MRESANLTLSSPSVVVPETQGLRAASENVLIRLLAAMRAIPRVLGGRRPRKAWKSDLPWNAGMDRLAEVGYPPPWIPRG